MNHSERAHAILAPSAADRWFACPGSLILSQQAPPQRTSKFAAEGTTAHEYAEVVARCLLNKDYDGLDQVWDELDEEDVPDPSEMREHVLNYGHFVVEIVERFKNYLPDHLHTSYFEKQVKYSDALWGTADFLLVATGATTEILLADLKYGRGVEVDVEDNMQLVCYALAAEKTLGIVADRIRLFVYQPRIPGRRLPYVRDTIEGEKLAEIRKLVETQVNYASNLVKIGKTQPTDYQAGEHCRFCPAQPICKVFVDAQREANVSMLDDIMLPELPVLTLEQLTKIQAKKKQIEAFLDSVEAYLTQRIESGLEVPGYKIVKSNPRRGWDKEQKPKEIGAKLKELGVKKPFKEYALIGIGEVEKVIGKGKIGDLTTLSEPRNQLVPLYDERDAVGTKEQFLLTELPTS